MVAPISRGEVHSDLFAEARGVVARARSLDDAVQHLARWLELSVRLSRLSLSVLDPVTDEVVIASVWSGGGTALGPGIRMPARNSAFPECVGTQGPVICETLEHHPTLLNQILLEEGTRSWVAIPLRAQGRVVGLLALSSWIPHAFTDSDGPAYAQLGRAIEDILLDLVRRSRAA